MRSIKYQASLYDHSRSTELSTVAIAGYIEEILTKHESTREISSFLYSRAARSFHDQGYRLHNAHSIKIVIIHNENQKLKAWGLLSCKPECTSLPEKSGPERQ